MSKILTEFYDTNFFSTMWDTKRQFRLKGIRHNTINVNHTKFDVNVSEMQNPVDFCSTFQPWCENIQSPFLILENVLFYKIARNIAYLSA